MANKWQTLSSVIGTPWGNAQDGDLTISSNTTQDSESKTCTASGTTITLGATGFTDGDVVMVWQVTGTGAGQWEFAKVVSGGGTTSLTTQKTLQYTYATGAIVHKFPQYGTVTVDASKVWTATDWNGANGILGFIARDFVLNGSIVASGKGFRGGPGSGNISGTQGEGYPGSGTYGIISPNGSGGGAGINYQAGSGAGGGHGTAGSNGSSNPTYAGVGGLVAGDAAMTSLSFGGGGGSVGWGGGNPGSGNLGGDGGGLVFIYSRSITIATGSAITTSGLQGTNNYDTAGGSGAGGGVIFKCATATFGTNLVTANGGATLSSSSSGNGGAGGVGRIHVDYAQSYTGTTTPTLDATLDRSLFGGLRRTQII